MGQPGHLSCYRYTSSFVHDLRGTSTLALPYSLTRQATKVHATCSSHSHSLISLQFFSTIRVAHCSQPTNVRSYFENDGCHVHGHPSSGGIPIKRSANLVDLQLLSLPRLEGSKRCLNTREEGVFCELMRRVGGT